MSTSLHMRVEFPDPKRFLALYDCQEADHLAVQEWLDRHLRGDYLFKKGHLLSIIKRPTSKLYAVLFDGMYVGTVVFYHGSILHNIMIDPDFRGLGIGEAVIKHLEPSVIRAKTNMVAGDPVPFYQRLGYVPTALDPERPHIVVMEPGQPADSKSRAVEAVQAPQVPSDSIRKEERALPPLPSHLSGNRAAPGGVFILPPELDRTEEDARKWREYKARQKARQKKRTLEKQQLDAQYARRYDPQTALHNSVEDSSNGRALYSE